MRFAPVTALALSLFLAACAVESGPQLAATFATGVTAYDAGDKARAFEIWNRIADQDLAAQRNVAMMLRKGDGVKQDLAAAAALYRRAAEAGLPTAQADLADMLLKGEVGPPNPRAALPLLQAAAAASHPFAQFQLGQLYENGLPGVVEKDLNAARELYGSAASRGLAQAAERLKALGPPTLPVPNRTAAP